MIWGNAALYDSVCSALETARKKVTVVASDTLVEAY